MGVAVLSFALGPLVNSSYVLVSIKNSTFKERCRIYGHEPQVTKEIKESDSVYIVTFNLLIALSGTIYSCKGKLCFLFCFYCV